VGFEPATIRTEPSRHLRARWLSGMFGALRAEIWGTTFHRVPVPRTAPLVSLGCRYNYNSLGYISSNFTVFFYLRLSWKRKASMTSFQSNQYVQKSLYAARMNGHYVNERIIVISNLR